MLIRRLAPVLFKPRPPQYFVSASTGNDNNTGKSPAQAWQTLVKVENSTPANSDLLFNGDDTWDVGGNSAITMLSVPQSGIRIGRYGSGANPVFDGGGTFRNLITIPVGITNTVTRNLTLYNGGGGTGALWNNSGGVGTVNRLEDCLLDTHATDAGGTSSVGSSSLVQRVEIRACADDGWTCHGLNGVGSSVYIYDSLIHHCFDGLNHSVTNGGDIITLCENVTFYSNSSHDVGSLDVGTHTFQRSRFGYPGETQSESLIQEGTAQSVIFRFCLIDGTMSAGNAFPSISVGGSTTMRFENSTFVGNAAASGKTGNISISGGTLIFVNSLFTQWFRLANIAGGTVNADYCLEHLINTLNLSANTNRIGTNATDPLLVDPANGDFRLQAGSPARNAGTTYVGQLTRDYAGNAIGSPPSVGAYEYV